MSDNVIPIARGRLLRHARSPIEPSAGTFEELAREVVGEHVFLAERGRLHGRPAWRIRVDDGADVLAFFDFGAFAETYAALLEADPIQLREWLSEPQP